MDIEGILMEREELMGQKNKNLEKISELDEKIEECTKMANHYSIMSFLNNHNLELYRRKRFILEKGLRFSLINVGLIFYEKLKVKLLERENKKFEYGRRSYQDKISVYKKEKKGLENENISINNKIFIIDYELKKGAVNAGNEKVLVKEVRK